MVSQEQIAGFWVWFHTARTMFGNRFENQPMIAELDARIGRLGELSWETGPGVKNESHFMLAFSPSGDPGLLVETQSIIDAAPKYSDWEFYPAKPPRKWKRAFAIQREDGSETKIDASGARYVLFKHPDGTFDVLLADRGIALLPEDMQRTAAEVLIDGELGEAERMKLVGSIEVVACFDDGLTSKGSNIELLAKHMGSL